MSKQRVGWLPYGSDDDDVVFALPLTSESDITALVTAGIANGTNTVPVYTGANTNDFNSVSGFSPGEYGGYRIQLNAAYYAGLEHQGQLTYQIPRSFFCDPDASPSTTYSSGTRISTAQQDIVVCYGTYGDNNTTIYPGYIAQSGGSSQTFNLWTGNGGSGNGSWQYNQGQLPPGAPVTASIPAEYNSTTFKHSDAFNGDWVTVNVGWYGSIIFMGFNGILGQFAYRPVRANQFKEILLGLDAAGGTPQNRMKDGRIRNFQLSKRAPIFATHPLFRKVEVLSDSMFTNHWDGDLYRNATARQGVAEVVNSTGYRANIIQHTAHGGETINTHFTTYVNQIIANQTSLVIYRGGTNDVLAETSAATVYATLQGHMEKLLGVNGNPATSVKGVVIGTMPSMKGHASYPANPTKMGIFLALNNYILGLEDWWDSTYPGQAGRIKVVDLYYAWGAEDTPDEYFIGSRDGTYINLHTKGIGDVEMGRAYGRGMMELVARGIV